MATAASDTYSASSGTNVYAGMYPPCLLTGTVTMADVTISGTVASAASSGGGVIDHVWTPAKDGSGYVTLAGVADLPLNEWCTVANSKLSHLVDKLTAGGYPQSYDLGSGKIVATFSAWGGCAQVGGLTYFMANGGHADSSCNGNFIMDLTKVGGPDTWVIESMPSNPFDATYPWSLYYRTVSSTYTTYSPSAYDDSCVLPDGKPTSQHTYSGVYYDSTRNTIVRGGYLDKWTWDLTAKTWTRQKWTKNGIAGNFSALFTTYYEGTDTVYGNFNSPEEYAFNSCANNGVNFIYSASPTGWLYGSGTSKCRVGNTVQYFWCHPSYDGGGERWAIHDMATNTWTTGHVGSAKSYNYASEMMMNVYVPDWGTTLRAGIYGSSSWWIFDNILNANVAYTPVGRYPDPTRLGERCFYYAPWKCVVAIQPVDTTSNCIHVMRTG